MPNLSPPVGDPRRDFLKKLASILLGGISALVPAAAGLAVFLDPLRRKSQMQSFLRVSSLEALPADGTPRKFPVISSRTDAWNKFPDVPIGAVYLRRTGEKSVQAFNVTCPHAGCPVDYVAATRSYLCPCHNSTFDQNGERGPGSPSSRGLDSLLVELRQGNEVWVLFQNFQAGKTEKTPKA